MNSIDLFPRRVPSFNGGLELRSKSYAFPQRRGLEDAAVGDHAVDLPGVGDVLERAGVEDDEIAALADVDRSAVALLPHHPCRNERRRLQRFERLEPGFHVQLDLPMQAEAGHRLIRAGD